MAVVVKLAIGLIAGFGAALFSTIAVTASAVTVTTAFFAFVLSAPFVVVAFICVATRLGVYGVFSTVSCLLSPALVHTLPIRAEYILVGIYSCLCLIAITLVFNYWLNAAKKRSHLTCS